MCEHDDVIVVIGKRKLFDSQFIEAFKSHEFDDVATSEAREIKKPNKKMQSTFDSNVSFL